MLENILNLEGIHVLNKDQQANVSGGKITCSAPSFSHFDLDANGGQGGAVYTQECERSFLSVKTGSFTHSFVSDQYY